MKDKIQDQVKDALRAKDVVRLTTLRGVLTAFTNELVVKGKKPSETLAEADSLAVVRRLVKQRKDSIEQFEKGGRQDLVENEKAEMKILEEFLPIAIPEEKVREVVMKKKGEMGITDKTKMGQLMSAVMKELAAGGVDGTLVKKIVEEILN